MPPPTVNQNACAWIEKTSRYRSLRRPLSGGDPVCSGRVTRCLRRVDYVVVHPDESTVGPRPGELVHLLLQELPVGVLKLDHVADAGVQRVEDPDAFAHLVHRGAVLTVERDTHRALDHVAVVDAVGLVLVAAQREARVGQAQQSNAFHAAGGSEITPAMVFHTAETMLLMSASVDSEVIPCAQTMTVKLGAIMVGARATLVASVTRAVWPTVVGSSEATSWAVLALAICTRATVVGFCDSLYSVVSDGGVWLIGSPMPLAGLIAHARHPTAQVPARRS